MHLPREGNGLMKIELKLSLRVRRERVDRDDPEEYSSAASTVAGDFERAVDQSTYPDTTVKRTGFHA